MVIKIIKSTGLWINKFLLTYTDLKDKYVMITCASSKMATHFDTWQQSM